nr:UBN2_2 domain-containing protein [Tanacetum cinerariifolium]
LTPTAIINCVSGIKPFSGINFSSWKEQVKIFLGITDLDYALRFDKPNPLTATSTVDEKRTYEIWERSNHISLMIMKNFISLAIRGAISDSENAKRIFLSKRKLQKGERTIRVGDGYKRHVEAKLDSRTISCYFIRYPERSKGYRFYYPNHTTRIVETRDAEFLENGEISGSGERSINLNEKLMDAPNQELSILLYMENSTTVTSNEVVDIPIVDAPPHDENPIPPIVQQLRRSERTRRPVVHDDFITYLNKDDYDLGLLKNSHGAYQCPKNKLEQEEMRLKPCASVVEPYASSSMYTHGYFIHYDMLGRYQSNPRKEHWKAARKKLDSRTISCYFIRYPERSKGYRFYYPNHTTRIVETRDAEFLENGEISGSGERSINLNEKLMDAPNQELSILLYMENSTTVTSNEVVDIPIVDAPPHDENPIPPIVQQLRRSERTRRPVVHDDFITYLNKDDYDLGLLKNSHGAYQCPKNKLEQEEMRLKPCASVVEPYASSSMYTHGYFIHYDMLGRYQSNPRKEHWKAARKVEENASNKRKWKSNHNGSLSQRNKGHKVPRAHTAWPINKKAHAGSLPLCNQYKFHLVGKVGHIIQNCGTPATAKNQQTRTCYECGSLRHYKSECPIVMFHKHVDMIHGRMRASKPKTMQDAIEIASKLRNKKINTLVECQTENKKRLDNTSKNNQNQRQPNKRQNTGRAYTARHGEKKHYNGAKSRLHDMNVGTKGTTGEIVQSERTKTMKNQIKSTKARGVVHAFGGGETEQDLNNIEDEIEA